MISDHFGGGTGDTSDMAATQGKPLINPYIQQAEKLGVSLPSDVREKMQQSALHRPVSGQITSDMLLASGLDFSSPRDQDFDIVSNTRQVISKREGNNIIKSQEALAAQMATSMANPSANPLIAT